MNSQSNIINDGLVATGDGYIYYSNITSDDGRLYRMNCDCSEKVKLSDDTFVKYINVIDSNVYYSSDNYMYILNLLSKEKELIGKVHINEKIQELNIVDNFAFYTTDAPKSSLYKMNLLTKEICILSDDSPMFINILQDYIIYLAEVINEDSIYTCIYKMKFDGSEKTNIIDDNAWYINIINDDFYYASDKNEGHLYMLDNKTGTTCEIFDHSVSYINNDKQYIYFIDNNKNCALYKVNIENFEIKVLEDCFASNIHLINDFIYYLSFEEDEDILCRIRKDGTDKQIIY